MAITINIYYTGENGNSQKFVSEMFESGIVEEIRMQKGNIKYEYFASIDNSQTILLVDSWENQEALDRHHSSDMMQKIIDLREKYNLSMEVKRFISNDQEITEMDKKFIK